MAGGVCATFGTSKVPTIAAPNATIPPASAQMGKLEGARFDEG